MLDGGCARHCAQADLTAKRTVRDVQLAKADSNPNLLGYPLHM
jgi:hypothetical protein